LRIEHLYLLPVVWATNIFQQQIEVAGFGCLVVLIAASRASMEIVLALFENFADFIQFFCVSRVHVSLHGISSLKVSPAVGFSSTLFTFAIASRHPRPYSRQYISLSMSQALASSGVSGRNVMLSPVVRLTTHAQPPEGSSRHIRRQNLLDQKFCRQGQSENAQGLPL
jgi:hypothetical protein